MEDIERTPRQIRCHGCSQMTPDYDIINCGSIERGYRKLCGRCFNTEVARAAGLEGFQHASLEPVTLADSRGQLHEFHFRTRLFGPGVALDAFELRDGHPAGYFFQIIGAPDDDLLTLLGRLVAKMRRALLLQHLVDGEHGVRIANREVRGRIEWNEAYDGRLPLLVIDGREIDWNEFGRMLMSFEGWQFKLTIADMSEEV